MVSLIFSLRKGLYDALKMLELNRHFNKKGFYRSGDVLCNIKTKECFVLQQILFERSTAKRKSKCVLTCKTTNKKKIINYQTTIDGFNNKSLIKRNRVKWIVYILGFFSVLLYDDLSLGILYMIITLVLILLFFKIPLNFEELLLEENFNQNGILLGRKLRLTIPFRVRK
jgi:hypothetical protein